MRRDISKSIFILLMIAFPLGGAYAQDQTVILDCHYDESNHQQRADSDRVDWMPSHEVIYRICDGCKINEEALREPGASSGIDLAAGAPVWMVTESEYNYEYSNNAEYGGVKINRYSGAATIETHYLHDSLHLYIAGDGYYYLSHGTCKKVDKPAL